MFFIKCENCGFENPLQTEYLTFCSHCGKKLQQNFKDWKKSHPTKEFEDFKAEAGSKVVATSIIVKRAGFPVFKVFVAFSITIIAILFFYLIHNGSFSGIFLSRFVPETVLQQKWQRFSYGNSGLSLVTPEKLKGDKLIASTSFHEKVQDMDSYSWQPSKSFRLFVINVLYREGIPVNLNLVATGAINELVKLPGIANVEYHQSQIMNQDIPGILVEGKCHENEVFMNFQCALFIRKSNVWSVTVIYPVSDTIAKEVASRILKSVEINYPDKTI